MIYLSKSCAYPSLASLKFYLRVLFKDFALLEGGEVDVMYTRCIESQEPEVFEPWDFAEDGIREVHPYARVQIIDDFIGETFYTHFFNAREVRIPFLGRRSVNVSVKWLDVPHSFG